MYEKYSSLRSKPSSAYIDATTIREMVSYDISNVLMTLNTMLYKYIRQPELSIYSKDDDKRILLSNKLYFGYPNEKIIQNLDDITDDIEYVMDSESNEIFDKKTIMLRHKLFNILPAINTEIVDLVIDLVYKEIVKINYFKNLLNNDPEGYSNHITFVYNYILNCDTDFQILYKYLNDEIKSYINSIDQNQIDDLINNCNKVMDDILNAVYHFALDKPTYIYFVEVNNGILHVGRSIDIRAYRFSAKLELLEASSGDL